MGYTAPRDGYLRTKRCGADSKLLPLVRAQAQFSMGQDQTTEAITASLNRDLSIGALGSQYNLRSVLDLLLGTIFIQNGRPIKIDEAVLAAQLEEEAALQQRRGPPHFGASSWWSRELCCSGHFPRASCHSSPSSSCRWRPPRTGR